MNTAKKVKKPTRAQLERKILELDAMLIHQYHFADAYLEAIKPGAFMGSGVILQLSALGGKELFKPVMIKDGLSPETIAAIRRDLVRSYEDAVMFKPKGSEV
jgi:hypothetical protein